MSAWMRSLRQGRMKGKNKMNMENEAVNSSSSPATPPQSLSTHPEQPPPAYTPTIPVHTATRPLQQPSVPVHQTSTQRRDRIADNSPYAFLHDFDTILVVDDSGSMHGSRWTETKEALSAIAPICAEFDEDGFDIYFLNHRNWSNAETGAFTKITTPATVDRLFREVTPKGRTPTGSRLHDILNPYLQRVEAMSSGNATRNHRTTMVKPINVIVITDGSPTDDVETVVVRAAKRLDKCDAKPWQVGIQFVQVGNDSCARDWLESLDDVLHKEYDIRDIVDTAPWRGAALTSNTILKIMLGGVDKRYDRQSVSKIRGR
ncbi:hypothetical protein AJ78_01483 [Emergomyces pasteurianus Ep9510]|uniref:VWFA domain-containing protein n=1 Tax=Emergomyces pasteurianus Ep9510 TaxID=1447872 RepID=A0A1J9PQL6_9EURO|nr:hypothetical protein AJ78_01483 [Emergomyces pasteurianus Ep9510]